MSNHTTDIYYEDLRLEVEFDYYPYYRGDYCDGLQVSPAEPESWEICTVKLVHPTDKDVKPVDVTDVLPDVMNDWLDGMIEDYIQGEKL